MLEHGCGARAAEERVSGVDALMMGAALVEPGNAGGAGRRRLRGERRSDAGCSYESGECRT